MGVLLSNFSSMILRDSSYIIRQKDGVIGVGDCKSPYAWGMISLPSPFLRPPKWISGHATYSLFLT